VISVYHASIGIRTRVQGVSFGYRRDIALVLKGTVFFGFEILDVDIYPHCWRSRRGTGDAHCHWM